jgi:hypothetical protein
MAGYDSLVLPKGWRLAASYWGKNAARRRHATRGAAVGVLIWDWDAGEGEVLLRPDFRTWCGVAQADAMSDWVGLLDREMEGETK